jgi:hypothetical protein
LTIENGFSPSDRQMSASDGRERRDLAEAYLSMPLMGFAALGPKPGTMKLRRAMRTSPVSCTA